MWCSLSDIDAIFSHVCGCCGRIQPEHWCPWRCRRGDRLQERCELRAVHQTGGGTGRHSVKQKQKELSLGMKTLLQHALVTEY